MPLLLYCHPSEQSSTIIILEAIDPEEGHFSPKILAALALLLLYYNTLLSFLNSKEDIIHENVNFSRFFISISGWSYFFTASFRYFFASVILRNMMKTWLFQQKSASAVCFFSCLPKVFLILCTYMYLYLGMWKEVGWCNVTTYTSTLNCFVLELSIYLVLT